MTALEVVQKLYPNVSKVKDATKDIEIEVTVADTQSKAVRNHKECAMAQACYRTHIAEAAIIARKVVYLIKGDVATRYITPESVTREIVSFDRNAGFSPGVYHLRRPSESIKLGSLRPPHQKLNKRKNSSKLLHKTINIRSDLRDKVI